MARPAEQAGGGRDGAVRLYFLDNLRRLVAAKGRWDRSNHFHSAQSIPREL